MDKLRFKGSVSVAFDPAKIEARFKLTRAGDGLYDEPALMQLLADAGVVGADADEVSDAVLSFQKSKNTEEEVVVVRGTPPVPGTLEVWEWEDLGPLTDALKDAAPPVIKSAGAPDVFRTRVDRSGPKPREVRERVLVDPNPGAVAWVKTGDRVARVVPPKAGTPGKNVLGQSVPAPVTRAGAVFAGRGLTRRGAAVFADVSGFLRRGRDWADVVPYEAESMGSDRDGSYAFRYNDDRSMLFLDVVKPRGNGVPVDLRRLLADVRAAELRGVSLDGFERMMEKFLSSDEPELKDFVLTKGTPPVRGRDLELEYTIDFLPGAEVKALRESLAASGGDAVPDADKLPAASVQKAAPVHAGQEFARLEPPRGGEGKAGVDVTGKPIPAPDGNPPNLTLLSNVRLEGRALIAAIDGMLEIGTGEPVAMRVRPHSDALVAVARSADNFEATATIVQGQGTGRRLEKSLLDAALAAAQIRYGVDEARLAEIWADALAGKPVESVLIARGSPSASDVARRLKFAQPTRTDAEGKQRVLVRAGEEVAVYLQPAEGEIDGRDVLGNLIPSVEAEPRSLVVSPEFSIANDDAGRLTLTALKSGELVFDGDSVSIVTQIAVAAVGGKAGNVKFPGEVIVAGPVASGAYVMAGNLKVQGRVGAALLSSDRNLQVASGIHGEGKAVLRAKNHVSVGFVERALIMAVGDVHIGKTALGCTFRVNGKILQKTPEGGVQGGSVKVRLGLDVMNLGSPSGHLTTVSFGQDYLVEDQIQAEVKETDKLREAIVKLDVFMKALTASSDREKLNGARQRKVLMMKMLDKRNLRLINLRDKFDLHVPSEILVRENLYPGVSIESHGRVYEVKTKLNAVKITFSEQTGRIEVSPLV